MLIDSRVIDHIYGFTNLGRHRLKIVSLGNLNMQGTYNFFIAHGLTDANIREVTGYIQNDAQDTYIPFNTGYFDNLGVGAYIGPRILWGGGSILIMHAAGGVFDAAGYSSILIERGKAFIWYED